MFADLGIIYFGAWPEGFAGAATRGSYALDIESANGINVRIPPFFPIPQTLQAMGYQTASIDWFEVFTSIQTGVVDGDVIGANSPPVAPILYMACRIGKVSIHHAITPTLQMIFFVALPVMLAIIFIPALSLAVPRLFGVH